MNPRRLVRNEAAMLKLMRMRKSAESPMTAYDFDLGTPVRWSIATKSGHFASSTEMISIK